MSTSSLEHKTIRPGSLSGYSYYHSDRHPISASNLRTNSPAKPNRGLIIAVVLIVLAGFFFWNHRSPSSTSTSTKPAAAATTAKAKPAQSNAPAASTSNQCSGNKQDKLIKVSIKQRHLWACAGGKTAYDSPVITGIMTHDSTLTPIGTYHIYDKKTDLTLTGSDETGSWNDPVKYWMPFLNNLYGTYGFHDATWRPDSDFGKVDPYSENASHGCVELPLSTSKWLYDWSRVGTTVSIEN